MKNKLFLFALFITVNIGCNKQYEAPDFKNEISFVFSRSDEEGNYKKTVENVAIYIGGNAYTVLNGAGNYELHGSIYFDLSEHTDIPLTNGTLEFLWDSPDELFEAVNTQNFFDRKLKNPEDYKKILGNIDPDNSGMRLCLSNFYLNGCATKGWYGDEGELKVKLKKHQLFEDETGNAKLYLEGKLDSEIPLNNEEKLKFNFDGTFKVVLDI